MNPEQQPQHPVPPPNILSNSLNGPAHIQQQRNDLLDKNGFWQTASLPQIKKEQASLAFSILSRGVTNFTHSLNQIAKIGSLCWEEQYQTKPNNFSTRAVIATGVVYAAAEVGLSSLSIWSAVALVGAALAYYIGRATNNKYSIEIVENPRYRCISKKYKAMKQQCLRALNAHLNIENPANDPKNIIPEQFSDLIVSYLSLAFKDCLLSKALKSRVDRDLVLYKVHTAATLLDIDLPQDARHLPPNIFCDYFMQEAWVILSQVAIVFKKARACYAHNQPSLTNKLEFHDSVRDLVKMPLNVGCFEPILYELRTSHLKSLQ